MMKSFVTALLIVAAVGVHACHDELAASYCLEETKRALEAGEILATDIELERYEAACIAELTGEE